MKKMNVREALIDMLGGVTKEHFEDHLRMEVQLSDRRLETIEEDGNVLMAIAACETPKASSTVKRMAKKARDRLHERYYQMWGIGPAPSTPLAIVESDDE